MYRDVAITQANGLNSAGWQAFLANPAFETSCVWRGHGLGFKGAGASTILCNCIVDFIRCRREPPKTHLHGLASILLEPFRSVLTAT